MGDSLIMTLVRGNSPAPADNSGKLPTTKQTTRRGLESLPPELLLIFAAVMPLHSRLVFSQTCSSFYNIIQSSRRTRCSAMNLDRVSKVKYLTAIVRDLPDKWVCDKCLTLHPVDHRDTPKSPLATGCVWAFRHTLNGRKLRWPRHRHVQLALKYTRLGVRDPEQKRYLDRLLDPVFGSHPPDPFEPWIAHVTYAGRARIVQGRYLLKYTWYYNASSQPIESLGCGSDAELIICNHQRLTGYMMAEIVQRLDDPEIRKGPPSPPPLSRPSTAPSAVQTAAHESLLDDQRGLELAESCPQCPTDFSVCVGDDCVWFSAWHDLGPEGSACDEAWACHALNAPYSSIGGGYLQAAHVPGSIRRLYEQATPSGIKSGVE